LYNRYIVHSTDDFIPMETPDTPLPPPKSFSHQNDSNADVIRSVLRHLSPVDLNTGDLLLLGLFVYLLNKKADEELLISMGLLLIL